MNRSLLWRRWLTKLSHLVLEKNVCNTVKRIAFQTSDLLGVFAHESSDEVFYFRSAASEGFRVKRPLATLHAFAYFLVFILIIFSFHRKRKRSTHAKETIRKQNSLQSSDHNDQRHFLLATFEYLSHNQTMKRYIAWQLKSQTLRRPTSCFKRWLEITCFKNVKLFQHLEKREPQPFKTLSGQSFLTVAFKTLPFFFVHHNFTPNFFQPSLFFYGLSWI